MKWTVRSLREHPSIAVIAVVSALVVSACGSDTQSNEARTFALSIQLEAGESTTQYVSTHCGYEWLSVDVNGERWTTQTLGSDSAGNPTERAWPNGEATDMHLTLIDPSTLEVTIPGSGVSHLYSPGSNEPGCI